MNANEAKRFQEALEMHEMHPIVNEALMYLIGKTCKNESNPIDSLAATQGIFDYIDEC